ncbi:MAG: peptidylprolyl isomerase [Gammaproteobacteria bacterium]|nr:peptidylprolyl isomerase [Gammaproteobacteria bacterium]
MQISQDCAVAIDFTMTDIDGTEYSSTKSHYPYRYLHGHRQLLPGLEKVLEGKKAGDSFSVTVSPEEAYGVWDENRRTVLSREDFSDDELVIGHRVDIMTEGGRRMVTVIGFDQDKVILDTNHELVGKTLKFDVKILSVRKATIHELGCGTAHETEQEALESIRDASGIRI